MSLIMSSTKRRLLFLASLFLLIGPAATAQEAGKDFVLIVHANNPIETLSKKAVADFFLKKQKFWDGGKTACAPVDQLEDAPVRLAFSEAILDKRPRLVERYWQRMIFSGRDSPPSQRSSDQEVITFVASDIGGIGYVTSGTKLSADVKAIEVTPN